MLTLSASVTKFTNMLGEFIPIFKSNVNNLAQAAEAQADLAAEFKKARKSDVAKRLKPEAPSKYEGESDKAEGFIAVLKMYFEAMDVDDED